ncbi:LANO_0E14862g1_1 [Lachancea nothofagi CBS 11611]|uniref:LANO_0E14862g1_1 n=1 Tax=Lachancea nothofagi CBS 11611 TaxID=1266666 RepID=A0A1G4K0E3_9SACH|nr:LANO_0E14862g1_1 [Lachancea nothofagi CBS 11611]
MDKYTNIHHPDYVPGTFNIYSSNSIENGVIYESSLRKTKNDIVLIPQPSESPNDPLNWSKSRKMLHFALMAFITAFTAATSNDAGAAQDSLNEDYDISYDSMNTGAGVLFLGIGWATLFLAPLANLYGRKITYIICTVLGLIGAIWFANATKTTDTIWSQLFVGISESCAEAQVQLSLSDIFFQHQLGSVLTVYILSTSVGTFLGPLIAGYISALTSFRWVGWVAAIISGALLIFIIFGCEETYFDRNKYMTPVSRKELDHRGHYESQVQRQPLIESSENSDDSDPQNDVKIAMKHKTEKASDIDQSINASIEDFKLVDGSDEKLKPLYKRVSIITKATNLQGWGFKQYFQYLALNMRMFLFPPVWLSGMFWGIQDVFLTFYLTTEETLFYDAPWNYSDYAVAIMNVPTLIGAVIGCIYAGIISDYFVLWMARRNNGILEAEYRLYFSFATGIIGPAGLLMFGIGAARELPWQVIYVGLGFIGFSWGCSGDIAMAYLMDCYPDMILEGMVCTAIINNSISCIFTFVCSDWLDASGTENTYIALAIINLGITLFAVPMYIWGKKIRIGTKKWYISSIALRDGV